jgi:hypothetical protein
MYAYLIRAAVGGGLTVRCVEIAAQLSGVGTEGSALSSRETSTSRPAATRNEHLSRPWRRACAGVSRGAHIQAPALSVLTEHATLIEAAIAASAAVVVVDAQIEASAAVGAISRFRRTHALPLFPDLARWASPRSASLSYRYA